MQSIYDQFWSQHLYNYCGNNLGCLGEQESQSDCDQPINMIDPTGHVFLNAAGGLKILSWIKKLFKVISKTKNAVDAKNDMKDIDKEVNMINQYTSFDKDNIENAGAEGQSPDTVYLLPIPIKDTEKVNRPWLSEKERAEEYAKDYRNSLKTAVKGGYSSTEVYRNSWYTLKNIDLASSLVIKGAGGAISPSLVDNLYFMAIEMAGKGKEETSYIIIWGKMGAK